MNKNAMKVVGLIVIAVLSRWLPHPPNFTPVTAVALFAGAMLSPRLALFIPLIILFVSDLILGFYPSMLFNYSAVAAVSLLGFFLKEKTSWIRIGGFTITGTLVFFIISNFGVWAMDSLYPRTLDGFISCYVMAIPFLGNTLAGDLFYSSALFGLAYLLEANRVQLLAQK